MTNAVKYLTEPYELIERPLWFHKCGLSETRSGYGSRLRSSKCVKLADGRIRRVYVTCWSNAGTAWVVVNGERLIIRD